MKVVNNGLTIEIGGALGHFPKEFVISALEKQISRKVKYLNRHGSGSDLYNKDYFNCPSCGRRLRNKQKDNHCGRCGQALDWSDTE